ncbi:MAG TPA: hypothetical protein VHJ20_20300 [Polyangia bacterium]|nr:hypothetical protein [Polyangia bacterium]
MIRNTMFGLSLMALTAGSALAAPVVKHHTTTRTVAEAPAGETAPAADKAAKPEKKAHKAKKEKAGAAKDAPKAEEKPAETK